MTERQLREVENRVYRYSHLMEGALTRLAEMATDILGYEVHADICGGGEIEFRPLDRYGYVEDMECIRMDDILAELNR